MPLFDRWDVIAVPFPYVERPIQQRRPALVVVAGLGGPLDLLWVLMITSAANPRWPDDVEMQCAISVADNADDISNTFRGRSGVSHPPSEIPRTPSASMACFRIVAL